MKKPSRKNLLVVESNHFGIEPKWKPNEPWDEMKYLKAMNWVNNFGSNAVYKNYVVSYVKEHDKPHLALIQSLEDREFNPARNMSGLLCWARLRGATFPPDIEKTFSQNLHDLIVKSKFRKRVESSSVEDSPTQQKTVSDAVTVVVNTHCEYVEIRIDNLMTSPGFNYKFDARKWAISSGIKPLIAKKIAESFQPMLDEISLARTGSDEQLTDGYSNYTPKQMEKYQLFLETLIRDLTLLHETDRKQKNPKKTATAEKQISRMKWSPEDVELKISGVHPTKLVGAKEVWYWRADKKDIHHLVSDGPSGFSIRGTTIQNIDSEKSSCKTVRKPEALFDIIRGSSSAKKIQNAYDRLTTKSWPVTGRTNDKTVFLNIFN